MSDFFKFEEDGVDFPFYNGIPKLSMVDWVVLALAPFLVGLITLYGDKVIPYYSVLPDGVREITYFLVTIIPFAYVCREKLGLIFKKPRLKDFKVIIICFILYFAFGYVAKVIGASFGFQADPNAVMQSTVTIWGTIFALIQLVGEELFKVSLFLIGMGLIYYFTKNRKGALVFGILASMIIFGLMHLSAYNNNLFQCLFIIGFGSFFHLYPYLKTKNVFNTYILHVMIELTFFSLMAFAQHYHYAMG